MSFVPVATAEIADIFAVSKSTICNWVARNKDFPEPVADLKMGKIWDREEIVRWGRKHKKIGK